MKKRMFLIAGLAAILVSCVNTENDLYKEPDAKAIVSNFVMTEKFEVPMQEGYNTAVLQGEDTLYYGNVPMEIDVPKFDVSASTRAADDLKWYFTPTTVSGWGCTVTRSGILLFEDLDTGDSDYNDFVCAIREVTQYTEASWTGAGNYSVSLANIQVKPLALGNTFPLKLGIECRRKNDSSLLKDLVVVGDVRNGLFGGRKGFINTTNELIVTSGYLDPVSNSTGGQIGYVNPSNLCILWYIEVDGVKRYVADAGSKFLDQKFLGTMVTENRVPFGLFVSQPSIFNSWKTTFRWPLETKSIFSAYPNFNKWLKGEVNTPFGNPNTSLLFDTNKLGIQ